MPCDRVMSLYDKHRDECLYSSLCLCIYDERRYTGSTLKNLVLGHGCSCKGCSAMYLIGGQSARHVACWGEAPKHAKRATCRRSRHALAWFNSHIRTI